MTQYGVTWRTGAVFPRDGIYLSRGGAPGEFPSHGKTLHDSYKVTLILKCTIMVGMAGLYGWIKLDSSRKGNFKSETTIAFYKYSVSLYSSDNPTIVSQVKQPTIFLAHHSIQQHVQSSEQELTSQATASTTWPSPLRPFIMKWISSVELQNSYLNPNTTPRLQLLLYHALARILHVTTMIGRNLRKRNGSYLNDHTKDADFTEIAVVQGGTCALAEVVFLPDLQEI